MNSPTVSSSAISRTLKSWILPSSACPLRNKTRSSKRVRSIVTVSSLSLSFSRVTSIPETPESIASLLESKFPSVMWIMASIFPHRAGTLVFCLW